MKVLRPPRRRHLVLCLVFFLPAVVFGRTRKSGLPDGACGSPELMLEAGESGRAMVQQLFAQGMPWGDRALNEYVNRLGQNLARSSGSNQEFSFFVLYSPQVNAQSFPGGYIVVNSGVISLAANEAELASVLAHEIAHENSCDWRTGPSKGNLFELIALVPTVIFGGPAGIALVAGSGWAGTLARAKTSRLAEEHADSLSAQYLARAGYDPHAAAQFFDRLEAEEQLTGASPGGLLATHPRTLDREKQLEQIIPTLPPQAAAVHDDSEFSHLRQMVREYDEMYSRLVGVHVPGQEGPRPELSRRPVAENLGSKQ